MTRRTLLQAGAGGLLATGAAFSQGKAPSFRFPRTPRERLAVASYPFRDYIEHPRAKPSQDGKTRMPLTAFPAMVAERFQIRNIEPLDEHFASREPGYLKELRTAVEKAGCRIVNIPFSPKGSLADPDAAKRGASLKDAQRWIDTAVAVGSPSVRAHIEGVGGAAPDLGATVASLQALAAYGQQKQIVVNLENDDPRSEEANFLTQVIDRVASPWLRALPDFCNSMLLGDSAYNDRSLQAMFHRAFCISHVKDSEVDGAKVYRVDVPHIFQIARANGYRGYFSMEWEGAANPYDGTRQLIELSLKALA